MRWSTCFLLELSPPPPPPPPSVSATRPGGVGLAKWSEIDAVKLDWQIGGSLL